MKKFYFIGAVATCAIAISIAYVANNKTASPEYRETAAIKQNTANTTSIEQVNNRTSPKPVDTISRAAFDVDKARERLLAILKITDEEKRLEALTALFQEWMKFSPLTAIDTIHTLELDDMKPLLYEVALRVWSQDNPIAFENWLEGAAPDERFDQALHAIITDTNTPEESAMMWARYIGDVMLSQEAVTQVIERWMEKDPDGAVAWSLYNPDRHQFTPYMFAVISAKSPEQALITFAALSGASIELINQVLTAMSHYMDPNKFTDGAIIALETIPDNQLRKMAWDQLLPVLAESENRLAIAEIIRDSEESSARNIMQSAYISIWANNEPQTAAEFALTTQKGVDGQDYALKGAIDMWAQSDVEASSNWLESAYGSADTDLAASSFSYNATDNPETLDIALKWNDKIKDKTERERAIKVTVNHWFFYDEDGAIDYLRSMDIVPEEKQEAYIQDLRDNKRAIEESQAEIAASRDSN